MKDAAKVQLNYLCTLACLEQTICWKRAKDTTSNLSSIKYASTVYPKKYAHGFCFAVLCCGYTLTDFPISIRLTSLALWQSNDCPSASKSTLMNMDKYFMLIHYERFHNHNKAKHNKTVCIFLGVYCICISRQNILFHGMVPRFSHISRNLVFDVNLVPVEFNSIY